jgi:uncharacterized YccA/Bax inhibitor family protein
MMRSSNPALSRDLFTRFGYMGTRAETMSLSGTVFKTLVLLLLAFVTASYTWGLFFKLARPELAAFLMMFGGIGGLISAIATIARPQWSTVTAPIYAICQGFVIGGLSSVFEKSFEGIVLQAASLTFVTLFAMLFAYQTGFIQASQKFKLGLFAATSAIGVVYFISFILSFFGMAPSFLYSGGLFGIFFSLIVVSVAALNFILDFEVIETGVRARAPQYMEWYGGFALMVTLIWLYVEFLRLLSKLRERQ